MGRPLDVLGGSLAVVQPSPRARPKGRGSVGRSSALPGTPTLPPPLVLPPGSVVRCSASMLRQSSAGIHAGGGRPPRASGGAHAASYLAVVQPARRVLAGAPSRPRAPCRRKRRQPPPCGRHPCRGALVLRGASMPRMSCSPRSSKFNICSHPASGFALERAASAAAIHGTVSPGIVPGVNSPRNR